MSICEKFTRVRFPPIESNESEERLRTGDKNVVARRCRRKNGGTRATQISRKRSPLQEQLIRIIKGTTQFSRRSRKDEAHGGDQFWLRTVSTFLSRSHGGNAALFTAKHDSWLSRSGPRIDRPWRLSGAQFVSLPNTSLLPRDALATWLPPG